MTDPSWVLALLAAAVAMPALPSTARARIRALDPRRDDRTDRRPWAPASARSAASLLTVGGAAAFGGIAHLAFGAPLPVLPMLAGLLAGGAAGRMVSSSAAGRRRRQREAALVEAVGALAADLRAGRQPADAMAAIAGGPEPALQSAAVAAVWTVSERSGASAAAVLDRVEQDLRGRERQRREVATQLAGARSTATMLAVLPLLGMGLGAAMGVQPLHILFGTGRGQVILVVGTGLEALGLLWTARIVAAAGGGP